MKHDLQKPSATDARTEMQEDSCARSAKRTISKKTILNFLPRYPRTNDCARQFRHSIERADFI